MDVLEKQTRASRLINQAKILLYQTQDIQQEIDLLHRKIAMLNSQKAAKRVLARRLEEQAHALQIEYFGDLGLTKTSRQKSAYEIFAEKYGKENADLIKDDLLKLDRKVA